MRLLQHVLSGPVDPHLQLLLQLFGSILIYR